MCNCLKTCLSGLMPLKVVSRFSCKSFDKKNASKNMLKICLFSLNQKAILLYKINLNVWMNNKKIILKEIQKKLIKIINSLNEIHKNWRLLVSAAMLLLLFLLKQIEVLSKELLGLEMMCNQILRLELHWIFDMSRDESETFSSSRLIVWAAILLLLFLLKKTEVLSKALIDLEMMYNQRLRLLGVEIM